MTQSLAEYRADHAVHHASLTMDDDPDQKDLGRLGIVPGLPRQEYPRRLVRALVSPRLIAHTVARRISRNFAPRRRPLRTACFAGFQALLLLFAVGWSLRVDGPAPLIAWAVSWALPLTIGHHMSMVLYALGLHAWFKESEEPGWSGYAEKTGARFFVDRTPDPAPWTPTHLRAWARWWIRFMFWHLVVGRFFVIGLTDNGCHDAHHADPAGRRFDWANAAYARADMLDGSPLARAHFWHTWTLGEAIAQNFDQLAQEARGGVR
ncbi:hypothetical protein [Streptomyces sp. NPDC005533]|uniref:hypothetical protein n=1 Tax=Streptomyces sp. NPDC005533 TaxID=3364723 RepID=UPI0036B4D5D0